VVSLRLALLPLVLAGLHPLHTTYTELVAEPGGPTVTITVRAFSDDLNHAVHDEASTRVPDDSLLSRYVRAHLIIRSPGGGVLPLRWMGRRETGDLTWLTLEASVSPGLSGARLLNTMHLELFRDQVNIVQVRIAGRSESLLFTGGDGEKAIR